MAQTMKSKMILHSPATQHQGHGYVLHIGTATPLARAHKRRATIVEYAHEEMVKRLYVGVLDHLSVLSR